MRQYSYFWESDVFHSLISRYACPHCPLPIAYSCFAPLVSCANTLLHTIRAYFFRTLCFFSHFLRILYTLCIVMPRSACCNRNIIGRRFLYFSFYNEKQISRFCCNSAERTFLARGVHDVSSCYYMRKDDIVLAYYIILDLCLVHKLSFSLYFFFSIVFAFVFLRNFSKLRY